MVAPTYWDPRRPHERAGQSQKGIFDLETLQELEKRQRCKLPVHTLGDTSTQALADH